MNTSEFNFLFFDDKTQFNCTTGSEFLERDPNPVVIPIAFLYSLIFILGLMGNVVCCIVILKKENMHTATNYYLFNLAISDLFLLLSRYPLNICLLFFVEMNSPEEKLAVFLVKSASCASILTITTFTVERYLAICHPVTWHTGQRFSRVLIAIGVIWGVSVSYGVAATVWSRTASNPAAIYCSCGPKGKGVKYIYQVPAGVIFGVPMVAITVLYTLMALKLRRVKRESITKDKHESTAQILKMLVVVVVVFFICWMPFHIRRVIGLLMSYEEYPPDSLARTYYLLKYATRVLHMLSTAINPIIYNVMSRSFREGFKEILFNCLYRRTEGLNDRTMSKELGLNSLHPKSVLSGTSHY